jgi:uncharacterized tellurite resistance protein B-like protein
MLRAVRRFLNDITQASRPPETAADDERLAAAALLVHIISIDGVAADSERAKLRTLLQERFELGAKEAEALIGRAHAADAEAVDLYAFTSVLKAKLDEEGRSHVIEMMWEIVFADGEVHEFEENLVWRVAELLGVPARERVRLKQRARRRWAN